MRRKRYLILCGFVLVLIGLVVYLSTMEQNKKVLVDGTNTNPVSYTEASFYKALKNAYPALYAHLNKSGSQDSYVIPGLEQTKAIYHLGAKKGKVGIATDMDPQGMAVLEDKYLLISAYSKSKAFNSVIWVLDKKTGRYLKTIALDDIDHVGGLSYDESHHRLWVAAINSQKKAQIESLSLSAIEAYDLNKSQKAITFENDTDLIGLPLTSYMTYYQNALYIGYFNKTKNGILARYDLDRAGLPVVNERNQASPARTFQTYDQIQGISFYEDKILLSQSYGKQDSRMLVFDNRLEDPNFDLDQGDAIASMVLPPYLEQIVGYQDKVYLLFESASHHYRQTPGIVHMDRIINISIEDLYTKEN